MNRNLLTWLFFSLLHLSALSQNTYTVDIVTDANGNVKSVTPGTTNPFTFYDPAATNASQPSGPIPTVVKTSGRGFALEIHSSSTKYCYSSTNAANINLWSTGGQAVVYLFALVYLFLGVSIVADVFMSAIEVITSQETTIITQDQDNPDQRIEINVQVWNETVANLTLMALGSSAPEILLAVLETGTTLGQPAGPLGASTIVGSAAFNLFIISAVCVISVPPANDRTGESGFRTLSQPGVFGITAAASVWAYFWMLVVLQFITPGFVDLWEAIVTLLQFPILVILAYAQDAGYFAGCCGSAEQVHEQTDESMGAPAGVGQKIRIKDATVINDDKHTAFQLIKSQDPTSLELEDNEAYVDKLAARIAAQQPEKKISRMQYRVNATRMMAGKKPLFTVDEVQESERERRKSRIEQEEREYNDQHAVELKEQEAGPKQKLYKTTFEFASRRYAVREDEGEVKVVVRRIGDTTGQHTVFFRTADGTADENEDYVPMEGTMVFDEGETQKTLEIKIIEDEAVEDDEDFFVLLENPTGESVHLGANNVTKVIIIDVSQPGELQFKHRNERCRETDGIVKLTVERVNGSMDKVGCRFETRDGTAVEGQHYQGVEGTVEFEHGETEKTIEIPVIDNEEVKDPERQFSVVLLEPFGKATLNDARVVANITISDDERYSKMVNRVIDAVNARKRQLSLDTASWRDQLKDAMEIGSEVTAVGYTLHALAFPWKVLFSFIPPTSYYNGWLTFIVSLACVGGVTFIIGEFASMLGCIIGISEEIVAITLVAMGTSMPDTFASRTATILAPDADAAIGNITGSNSVNVFLGLGLPWVLASIYGAATGKPYEVPAGTLDFAVTVFTPCAACVLGVLVLRRYVAGGELGGNLQWPTFILFCSIWGLFILLSVLKSTGVL